MDELISAEVGFGATKRGIDFCCGKSNAESELADLERKGLSRCPFGFVYPSLEEGLFWEKFVCRFNGSVGEEDKGAIAVSIGKLYKPRHGRPSAGGERV